jgi:DNA replication and repair protein RecF
MRRLRRILLRTFRNYAQADLEIGDGATVLVGENGQGKSNLIEAVYLIATGRSHRTSNEGETIMRGESAARLRAHVTRPGRDEEIELTIGREQERCVTQIRVNGAPTPRGSLLGRLPVVLATAWDLDLVRGPGSGRRRLFDGTLAQLSPAYFFSLHRYHQVVTQRNAELRARQAFGAVGRAVSARTGADRIAGSSLEAWDTQLLALGTRITSYRAGHASRLSAPVREWFEALGGYGRLEMVYRPAWPGETDEARMTSGRVYLARSRADEYRRGVTLTGPHRDDVEFLLDGFSLRAAGSQGQWRTAMLAVRFAERAIMRDEMGTSPLLLLDDALAELDPERQRRVFEIDPEAQVLISTTALPSVHRAVRVVRVQEGTLTEDAWSHRFERS